MALRFVLSGAIALATVIAAWLLSGRQGDGASLALSLILGLALGLAFQRSRFCFFCHARDFIEKRDPRGLLAILLALAIGAIGYHFLFGAWLPKPIPPRPTTSCPHSTQRSSSGGLPAAPSARSSRQRSASADGDLPASAARNAPRSAKSSSSGCPSGTRWPWQAGSVR